MQLVPVADTQLAVLQQGEGPPVLLVHGFPLDHSMWKYQIEHLARTHRVIAPDLRGLGQSPVAGSPVTMERFADDLALLLEALGVQQPVLYLGLSMGGYIAWEMLRRHRQRLRGLVLCDTKAQADTPEAAQARRQMAETILRQGMQPLEQAMRQKLWAPHSTTRRDEDLEHVQQVIARTNPRGAAAALLGMAQRADATELLPRIDLPVLVVCGEQDVLSPPEQMEAMARAIPGAHFALIPQAGHMAPLENPAEVNARLDRFVQSLDN